MNDDVNQPITEDQADTPTQAVDFDSESYQATQNLIARLSTQLEELENEQKKVKDMLKDVFDNDAELSTAEETAKEAQKTQKERQGQLNDTQQVKDLRSKISDFQEDIKMVKESLNTHLINYFQMTGSMSVDMPDGNEREFTLNARLKKAKNK